MGNEDKFNFRKFAFLLFGAISSFVVMYLLALLAKHT